MRPLTFHTRSREFSVLLALLMAIFVLSILVFPERAFQSSLAGLTIWWSIVFPSLLPFFMIGEMMTGFGIVRGFGTIMEPLMRLLFRIPGAGAWIVALGAVAGMPAGAEATGRLRRDGQIDREEAERILALSHVASPFFIITVVGAGFLHSAEAGMAIAIIHYASALAAALLLNGFGRRLRPRPMSVPLPIPAAAAARQPNKPLLQRALTDMHQARMEDGRTFGKLLGDSVSSAIQTLMTIGGTMIVFSVLLGMIETLKLTDLLAHAIAGIMPAWSSPAETVRIALTGIAELHLGIGRISGSMPIDVTAAAAIGVALAWSGLAVHVQVMTALRHTDMRYRRFLLVRVVHAALALLFTLAFWQPVIGWLQLLEQRFVSASALFGKQTAATARPLSDVQSMWSSVPDRMVQLGMIVAILLTASALVSLFRWSKKR
ncbi:MAG: ylbJ1 [Paenibacillus sp.]|jgi:sporulation integral membrane protein YlbJ|nr:ylbJ1 [Paenibacillus sp.]